MAKLSSTNYPFASEQDFACVLVSFYVNNEYSFINDVNDIGL